MEKRRSDVTEDELLFDAVLYPHRSLNSLGFRLLMLGVILISFLVGGLVVTLRRTDFTNEEH